MLENVDFYHLQGNILEKRDEVLNKLRKVL